MPISEIEMKSVSRAHLCSPMSSPVSLFLLFSLLLPALILPTTQTHASGLYFPQSDLSLRLPYLAGKEERFEPRGVELITLRALRNDSTEPREAKYRVSLPRGHPRPEVSIDQVTNRLVLRALPRKASSTLAIVVLAKDEEGNEATLELAVGPIRVQEKRVDCTDYVQDMCFWSTSRYRIYENQPTTRIGSLGPGVEVYADLCPGFSVTGYKLLNGSEYFDVADNALLAKAQLDRDVVGPPGGPGPRVAVLVQCVVWERNGTQHAPVRSLEIEVLDQDDNPPTAQGSRSLTRHLGDFVAGDKLDEDNLILKDADERSSNRYVVRILEDTHDALNVTCDLLPIEHPGRPSYTAIYAKIYAKTTLLPKSPYRVVLQATDESLLAGHGKKTLNITLTFFGPEHRTTTTTAASMSAGRRRVVSYPETVKISRISSRYSRVAAPLGKPPPSSRFSVEGSRAFGVTRTEGIVYVADRGVLKNEPATATLTVKWRAKDRVDSATIRVDLLEPSPLDAGEACRDDGNRERSGDLEDYEDDGEGKSALRSCANAETPEECESGCGVASGSLGEARANGTERFYGRCVWRWDGRSNVSRMSERYSTCSPDLAHCPDNRCDELELLNPRICPQDCVLEANLHFGEPNAGGRGIKSGMGTCACSDASRCTCNVDRFRALNVVPEDVARSGREETSRDSQNEIVVSGARKASNGPCGPICVAGVVGAGFFLLIAIVGSFATSRYRTTKKGSRREGKRRVEGEPSGIGMLPSDYVDRVAADGLLIGLDTFAAANRHLLLPKTRPPDPKWEFPRSRLTIEQVLGEGEFGRVLRAKAIDIAGIPGQTTVAVKTLKENACASELTDLLSEYQLLKEVQHPNVIRLLGACTTSAGPVYLIIEFAEFGSLRNYLRRSRRLDSFSPASRNASEQDASPIIGYTVTPRDVLSFAWQICKGMAYLADIKLVHRDLAARNVLLATGKLCKISDFGLTRDVYEDDAYLKRSKGRVPVKWMAPESLADHVYTSKSDVWSFGVLLWELVTLGASPYPGVDVHNLYNLLKAGYRMERPANCSPQLYKLMVSCWHQEPASRPSFRELVAHWERMLEDGVEYLDLNPRTVHNQTYFADSLRVLDSPNSSTNGGNEENDAGDEDRKDGRDGKNGTVDSRSVSRTDVVNYLGKPFADAVTKSDKVDKLRALWPEPVVSFPEEEPPNSSSRSYVNDPARSLCPNDYESPIKFRNVSVTSNSENDLASPISTNDRPRSYMDMEGKKIPETKDLLLFPAKDSVEEDRERSDRTNHFGSFGSHSENT